MEKVLYIYTAGTVKENHRPIGLYIAPRRGMRVRSRSF